MVLNITVVKKTKQLTKNQTANLQIKLDLFGLSQHCCFLFQLNLTKIKIKGKKNQRDKKLGQFFGILIDVAV